jgi:hypothetical protein
MRIDAPIITGSFSLNGDTFNDLGAYTTTGSNTFIGDQSIVGAISASALTGSIDFTNLTGVPTLISGSEQIVGILSPLNSFTASNSNTNTFTASTAARLNSIETISASNVARLNALEIKTGSLATTGSNTFFGTQTYSGSVYIANDLIVQGSSSIQYISASSVSIGTNIVQLNTANPSVRYAGLTIIDSGSIGGSGSFLYDSVQDEFIFVHRGNGTNITSSHFITGPETYDSLGNETYLTCNVLTKGTGKEHLVDSSIFDNGTTVCVSANLRGTANACFTSAICSCASSTLYAYFDGNNTVLPNPTDRPHIFRTSSGGLGLSANNEGAGSQPISMYTCGAQRFTILPNGNVGVNTNTPLSLLDVNLLSEGARRLFVNYDDSLVTIKSANSSQTAETLRVWGDNIIFNVTSVGSGVEAMRITNTCRVGIGTNTPCAVLHISNPAPYIYLTDTSTTGTRPTARIINGDVGTCQSLNFGFACNDGTTCGLDVITLNEKSNVGIGTNSPGTNLEICTPSQNCGNIRIYNGFNNGTNCFGLEFYRNYDAASNEIGGYVKYIRTGGSSGDLIFGIGERGSVNNRLRIEYTGVSCFFGAVCAPHFIGLNNISIGSSCTSSDGYNTRFRITCIANDTFVFSFNNLACKAIMYMYGGNTNNPQGYTAWVDNASGNTNHLIGHTASQATYFAIQGGCFGIGNSSPSGKLHVTTDGITPSAPQYSWPSYNSEADSNSRRIIFETAGNNSTSTAGYGASLSLVLGNYWDSRVIITPVGSGGASPGDQGTGHGKDMLIKGGTSDNGNGYNGGRLYLNGGVGYQSGYGPNVGHIIMQTIGSNGRVGIQTSSPTTTFQIRKNYWQFWVEKTHSSNVNLFSITLPDFGSAVVTIAGSRYSPGADNYSGTSTYYIFVNNVGAVSVNGGNTSGTWTPTTSVSSKTVTFSSAYAGSSTNYTGLSVIIQGSGHSGGSESSLSVATL